MITAEGVAAIVQADAVAGLVFVVTCFSPVVRGFETVVNSLGREVN